jgi:hypothetical protein
MLHLVRENSDHLEQFREKTEPFTGPLPHDELLNMYIQLNKNGRVFRGKHIFCFFHDSYNGPKQRVNIPEHYSSESKITIEGDTYCYRMDEKTFWGIYHNMQKACGFSKKAVKKLRTELRKEGSIREKKREKDARPAVTIIDYSEKAIAVVGDTKPLKDQLKAARGRFNPFLKDQEGNRFAGWVFSKKRKEQVERIIHQT